MHLPGPPDAAQTAVPGWLDVVHLCQIPLVSQKPGLIDQCYVTPETFSRQPPPSASKKAKDSCKGGAY